MTSQNATVLTVEFTLNAPKPTLGRLLQNGS